MEFLVALVKHHKNEVEEALQYDPTLRSEIEYDLKQFERAKKEKLIGKKNTEIDCFEALVNNSGVNLFSFSSHDQRLSSDVCP